MIIDHVSAIEKFFHDRNVDALIEWNCFQSPYDYTMGWSLRLPTVDWNSYQYLVLFFQDFVTMHQGHCVELQKVEEFYGAFCDRVVIVHWPRNLDRYYCGPLNLVEFNVHEFNILRNLAQCKHSWQQIWHERKDKLWQCLNGRKCPHRLWIVHELEKKWHNGTASLGDTLPLCPWPYSSYRGTSNEDNWIRLLPVYARHQFNIVTETQYSQRPGIISEKTFFALLAAQIPLIIGYTGIVQDCVDLGFDMFTDIIDISYDNLPDSVRWQVALDSNREILQNYAHSAQIQQRLLDQARWLIDVWPGAHLQQALNRLAHVIKCAS